MKKIAVFIGDYGVHELAVVEAVAKEAEELGIETIAFSNAGCYGQNIFYAYGEKSVIKIPNWSDYDGVIICADTLGIQGMYEELIESIEENAACPIVCLRSEDERFYNVLFDNCAAMKKMVEHFVTVHGFKKICFMTGRSDLKDSGERYLGYLEIMDKYNLDVTERMVFEGNYWRNKGNEAVEWFLGGEEMPEAIVCANDYMALSVCEALQKRGLSVPEDIAVSGFDDIDEVKYSTPTISSMYVPSDEMGRAAFHILLNVEQGLPQNRVVNVEVKESYKESCGCNYTTDKELQRSLFFDTGDMRNVLNSMVYMDMDFEATDTFEELMDVAQAYMSNYQYESLYICLCDEEEKRIEEVAMRENYTEHMSLRAIITPQKVELVDKKFLRSDILPKEFLKGHKHVHISPLHDKDNCLGYVVLISEHIGQLKYVYRGWLLGLAIAMERQKMYEENKLLMEGRLLYETDELTGIGNRRGIQKIIQSRYARLCSGGPGFHVLSADMDGLKMINDKYGHLEGDAALCALANILNECKSDKGHVARTGGDEYMLCLETEDKSEVEKVIEDIREAIDMKNRTWDKPYKLSASIGYALCEESKGVLECMRVADKNMYREKRSKKEARKD